MAVQNVATGGSLSLCWSLYSATCWRSDWAVLVTALVLAEVLALLNCGMTIAARMPRMITTIRISIRVKPLFLRIAFMSIASLKIHSRQVLTGFGPAKRRFGPCNKQLRRRRARCVVTDACGRFGPDSRTFLVRRSLGPP